MEVIDFTREHLAQAQELSLAGYEEERSRVPALPSAEAFPSLAGYAENGMGAAAVEQGKLVGFLCSTRPFEHAFGSTNARGVFSPMGANGAARVNRERIFAALYQHAARKWVDAGAVSHGICLYAHDEAAQRQFYRYGFGLRCVDAIRPMEPISCGPRGDYEFSELKPEELPLAYQFETELNRHFQTSPVFMNRVQESLKEFCASSAAEGERCFGAWYGEKLCAYIKISHTGETFLSEGPDYRHVAKASCFPEYRGSGINAMLLNYVVGALRSEGISSLGVDYESINPAAYGFWGKHFLPYTHGVVRRIDEGILSSGCAR